jgi:hypothetical protein
MVVETECLADVLGHTFGLPVQLHGDARLIVAQPMEGNDPSVAFAAPRSPCNPLVRLLFGDLGVPLVALAGDLGDPVQVRVIELFH